MLVKFERLERRVCGATKVVQTFLGSHYSTDTPPDLTLSAKAYILRQRRRFRDVVVDMGETEGAKVGKETFILNGKDNSGNAYTLNREKDIHNEPKDNGVDLLERMYRILSKNTGTEEEKKMECVNHLKAANVPLVDPDMVTRLNNAQEATIRKVGEVAPTVTRLAREGGRLTAEQVHTASERLHAYRTKQERQMTWWQKFIDRL